MNRIDKRAIEALAIAPVIKEVSQRLGEEEALAILSDVNQKEAFRRGQNVINPEAKNTIEVLVEDVATWGAGGIWEMDVFINNCAQFNSASDDPSSSFSE